MIQYFFEDVPAFTIQPETSRWLVALIAMEEKKAGKINYIFCSDERLLEVNKEYLQHDYFTDIITFDYVKGRTISADIFVSLPRISENSVLHDSTFEDEFHRVLAHGLLHLCGYKDKSESQAREMRAKENFYLRIR